MMTILLLFLYAIAVAVSFMCGIEKGYDDAVEDLTNAAENELRRIIEDAILMKDDIDD